MGAWGTGLYSDDTTCDVRDDYVRNLRQGASDDDAWRTVVAGFGELLQQREIACLVYFALADTAWRHGRLSDDVRAQALALLAEGGDAFVWDRDSPGADARARRRTLTTLETKLRSVQPARRTVKVVPVRPKTIRSTAPVGSTFLLPLPGGQHALLVLVGYHEMESSIDPVFSILRWRGDSPGDTLGEVHRLVTQTPTLSLASGLGPKENIGILPNDRPEPLLARLLPLNHVVEASLPFNPYRAMWITIGRIAKETDAGLAALGL